MGAAAALQLLQALLQAVQHVPRDGGRVRRRLLLQVAAEGVQAEALHCSLVGFHRIHHRREGFAYRPPRLYAQ